MTATQNTTAQAAFVCQMCGECCRGQGGIVMDAADRARLASHLGVTEEELLQQYGERRNGKAMLRSTKEGCVFLSENGCAVHEAKPKVCRAWPFFRGNLVDADSWEMALDACPGLVREAGHAAFVRQGRAYLQQHGLRDEQSNETGRALWPEDTAKPPAGGATTE